jgi:hypothetical protein
MTPSAAALPTVETTFYNLTLTIAAPTPANAYRLMCEALGTIDCEWMSDTYATEAGGEARPAHELWDTDTAATEALLAAARQAQTTYWDSLRELETALGFDLELDGRDLSDQTLESLAAEFGRATVINPDGAPVDVDGDGNPFTPESACEYVAAMNAELDEEDRRIAQSGRGTPTNRARFTCR